MQKTLIWLFVILVSSVPRSLMGQEKYGFEIGGFAGGSFWKEKSFQIGLPQAQPPVALELKYDNKILGGARGNILSRGHWGGEFSYAYQRNKVTLTRQDAALGPLSLDGSIQQFFYNMIFYLTRYSESKILPFVTGGIGLESYGLSEKARAFAADPAGGGLGNLKSLDTKFAYNYGVGIKAKLGPRFGVRFDFRHILSDPPSYGLPKSSPDPAQTILPIGGKLQNYEASVGFYFHTSSSLGN